MAVAFDDCVCLPRQGLEDRPVTANPEMGHFEAAASDFLLLVCDGVSEGNFSNSEVCQLAAKVLRESNGDAALASEAVIKQAIDAGSKDNISCMIVLFGPESPGAPIYPTGPKASVEFHAGSLLGCESSAGFVKAYMAMCERGGVSFGSAVEQRYAMLASRANTMSAEAEDAAELEMIGSPEGAPGSAARKAWFEEWAKAKEAGGGGGSDDDDGPDGLGLGAGGRDPMEQLAMLKMLLGAMHGGKGKGGGGKGGGGGRGGMGGRGGGMGGAAGRAAGRGTGIGRGR